MASTTTRILLARHGETDWNRERRFQGHADPPLNELGRRQARDLAESLVGAGLTALYASDLRRAAETAEVLGSMLGVDVVTHPGLREIDVGAWSGLTREEIIERFPGEWENWARGAITMRGGEPREVFQKRVLNAVVEVAGRHPGELVGLVAHGGVVRSLQRHVLGDAMPVLENGATWEVWLQGGSLVSVGEPVPD